MPPFEELATKVGGLEAWVIVDRFRSGLAGGGLRFHPAVSPEELRRLARTMTWKWRVLDLPFGGCKLGIRGDPAVEDAGEVLRRFAEAATPFLQDRVFTGPDMGTTPRDLRPFFAVLGQDAYDVVTRRLRGQGVEPTDKGGYRRILRDLQGRITGIGVAQAARDAWERFDGSLQDVGVAIQGYGSVGRVVAEEMYRYGARIVGIADARGSVLHPSGLDPRRLAGPERGLLNRDRLPEGTETGPPQDWLRAEADILIPAAVADAITRDDVDRVTARLVVEAANIPVERAAERALHGRGVLVLPDFLVNGGLAGAFGVLVTRPWRRPQDVEAEVVRRIVAATRRVVEAALRTGRPPREVAEELAATRT